MTNRKELPLGHGSSLIKFAKENLRDIKSEKKRERKDNRDLVLDNGDHREKWTKVNLGSFYLLCCYYPNGEDKILQGNKFAEGIKPINARKLSKKEFGKRLAKLVGLDSSIIKAAEMQAGNGKTNDLRKSFRPAEQTPEY